LTSNTEPDGFSRKSVCPACGWGYREGYDECPECGLSLTSEEKAVAGKIRPVCPTCELELDFGTTWCRRCGLDFSTGEIKVLINPLYCTVCAIAPVVGVICGLMFIFAQNRAFKKAMMAAFWSAVIGFFIQKMIFGEVFLWPDAEPPAS
jgi:predicted amidophosphoribosyltransferase